MAVEDPTISRYLNGDYAEKNPDWDMGDAAWKAGKVAEILADHKLAPRKIAEVGCGSGAVLVALRRHMPDASFFGYDIAPDAERFWQDPVAAGIQFELSDFISENKTNYDAVLLLDVIEHVGNPWDFLVKIRDRSENVVLHFPLDLSVSSVLREKPLLHVRNKVGHLHFYTKGLVLALLNECGYEVVEARFTGAAFNSPNRSFKTRLAGVLRKFVFMISHDLGARLLGGETLLVLARPRHAP